jgi:hypothetical protein
MNARPSSLRRHSLRVLVAISLPLALFWSLGLATDLGLGFDPPPAVLLVVSVFSTWGFLWLAGRLHRRFLSLPAEPSTRAILFCLAVSSVAFYCVGASILFVLGSLAVWLSHTQNREASLLVTLASLWLPLWFSLLGSGFDMLLRRITRSPNPSLQPTAGRSDTSHTIMKTLPLQSTLAPASGG